MTVYLNARGTCAGCGRVVDLQGDGETPQPHTIEVVDAGYQYLTHEEPCPGNEHAARETPPPGFTGTCQRVKALTWTRLSGSGDPGMEVFIMLDGRICTRPVESA